MTLAKSLQAAAGNSMLPNYIEDVFSTYLYTGNGSTQTITNDIDLAGEGGMVWLKSRSIEGNGHVLFDTTRGGGKFLQPQLPDAEAGGVTYINYLTSGFQFNGNYGYMNDAGNSLVSWTFRKQPKFFDVVTYTGNGVAGRQISHALGSAPGFILIKSTSSVSDWSVYHRSLGATQGMTFNSTYFAYDAASFWNNTAPTSSVFTVGTDSTINQNGQTYVAYLFAHNAGGFGESGEDNVVSCGSFTTSGNATVDLGYEPQWVIVKKTNGTGLWYMLDTMRGWTLSTDNYLAANIANGEDNPADLGSVTSTGFTTQSIGTGNFIYIAIRRGPMKTPTDGTSVFASLTWTGTGATANVTGIGFPSDLWITHGRNIASYPIFNDRLRGAGKDLFPNQTTAETTQTSVTSFASMDGVTFGTDSGVNLATYLYINYAFRRAPGFFDEVCYTGTGVARTVTHNLGVAPELWIVKKRSAAGSWAVGSTSIASSEWLILQVTDAKASNTAAWNSTYPSSTVFTVGNSGNTNGSAATYVAYLFATAPGVSKVGSYTGTGTTQTIPCGFAAGARFVLIKRTDSTGDWYVWDSARGIVAGNDPYLLLNSTAAEVTSTDYIDPVSSGFEISSTAPAAINASGGSYIFLAIA